MPINSGVLLLGVLNYLWIDADYTFRARVLPSLRLPTFRRRALLLLNSFTCSDPAGVAKTCKLLVAWLNTFFGESH